MPLFNTRRRATPAPRDASHGYDRPSTARGGSRGGSRVGPGWCASLGGAETITVTIRRHQPDNFYEMDACLSAPDLSQHEAQISAMLRTVHLTGGD